MGEYVPQAPINEEAKKHNQNLPGMGGVYNYINLHVYHYAGNNPVKLTDPDGRTDVGKILLGLISIAGSAGIFVFTIIEDGGTLGLGIADDIPTLVTAGVLYAWGRNLIASGLEDDSQPSLVQQNLTTRAQAVSSAPAPGSPDDPKFKDDKQTARDFGHNETSEYERTTKRYILCKK
jgi:hypothetical protein